MRKLVCKACGNNEFYALNVNVMLCKCGLKLSKPSDYRLEEPMNYDPKQQVEAITKLSLLMMEIDKCLDERNDDRFEKLTSELKACQLELKSDHVYELKIGVNN